MEPPVIQPSQELIDEKANFDHQMLDLRNVS